VNFWDVVDATAKVFEADTDSHHVFGITRPVHEGVAAMIQKATMDWISTEFKDKPQDEIQKDLQDRTDVLYASWVRYAERIYGINSAAGQQTGWEMIVGGSPSGNKSVVNKQFPGADRYY
jgi:hypothetical protein